MPGDLTGKQALVTGGSGDIGRAICRRLAARGAHVAFSYFSDHEGAARTEEVLRSESDRQPLKLRANFGDEKSTADFIAEARQKLGRIDLWVNNAASGVFRPALELQTRHLEWAMDV